MTFSILLDAPAFSDIQDAINYYETQKNGLGKQFEEALDKHFKTLTTTPFFQKRYGNVRCLPVEKFPYMIHFEIYESTKEIVIRAVLNTKINPEKWQK